MLKAGDAMLAKPLLFWLELWHLGAALKILKYVDNNLAASVNNFSDIYSLSFVSASALLALPIQITSRYYFLTIRQFEALPDKSLTVFNSTTIWPAKYHQEWGL